MMIKPFSAKIPHHELEDLKTRIIRTRWPDEITGSGWSAGTDLIYLKELANYWCDHFSWQGVEDEINALPNFTAEIDGFRVHFVHIRGNGKTSVPLIITHGWPGSFLEMLKLVPLLTNDPDFSFDLVIPSVPGFGFSGKASQPGCNSALVAGLWHKLMTGLGYERYGAQGGDIGAGISTYLAMKHPEQVAGLHLNYIPGSYRPYLREGEPLSPEVLSFQKASAEWSAREGAYAYLHGTKPQTLAYGLNDSPVGLCAWILEKFNSWSDNDGHIENVFSKDELLGNISLYWFTQTLPSSIRIYREGRNAPLIFGKDDFIRPPVAFSKFPKELPTPPLSYIKKGYNLQQYTEMPAGGHFAAMEQPELLSEDIKTFFRKVF